MFRQICKRFILLASSLLFVSVVSADAVAPSDSTIALLHKAVDGDWRSAAHKARDQYRHPIETLQFFGLKPDMTVIELQPGGGWYTEILAPVLYAHGHLLEATGPKFADRITRSQSRPLSESPSSKRSRISSRVVVASGQRTAR